MGEHYEKKGYLMEDFRLFHLKDSANETVDYHYHEFYKLLFLLSGSGSYYVEGKRYLLNSGDLVLIAPQCIHRPEFEPGFPYERTIFYISPEFLQQQSTGDYDLTSIFSGEKGPLLRPERQTGAHLLQIVRELETELSSKDRGREILSKSLLLRLLVEIGRGIHRKEVHTPAPHLPKNRRMLEIVQYLDRHLTEEISIDTLSEKFYLSRYHLMHSFREETGTTIHAYLTNRRLLLARDLITQGTPATQACFLCGFGSYASFSRAYGKLFGITPTGRRHSAPAREEFFE